MTTFCSKIWNVSDKVQWPAMAIPLQKVTQWRNENPNVQRRLVCSVAYLGIALGSVAEAIVKFALGVITLIPPFTPIGASMLMSIPIFQTQVLFGSINSLIQNAYKEKIPKFNLDLM